MVFSCLFLVSSFCDISLYACSYYFSSVSVAEWPPLGKWLLTRLTICFLYILTICYISYFLFLVLRAGFGFLIA